VQSLACAGCAYVSPSNNRLRGFTRRRPPSPPPLHIATLWNGTRLLAFRAPHTSPLPPPLPLSAQVTHNHMPEVTAWLPAKLRLKAEKGKLKMEDVPPPPPPPPAATDGTGEDAGGPASPSPPPPPAAPASVGDAYFARAHPHLAAVRREEQTAAGGGVFGPLYRDAARRQLDAQAALAQQVSAVGVCAV
jgi:hypothetical protein